MPEMFDQEKEVKVEMVNTVNTRKKPTKKERQLGLTYGDVYETKVTKTFRVQELPMEGNMYLPPVVGKKPVVSLFVGDIE